MPSEVILPRVDMDMTTGKIAKWFVENGAKVSKGQPLFEIETDKAAMEIEAPSSGTIRDLADASGRDIPVGSIVAWIDGDGEVATASPVMPRPASLPVDLALPATTATSSAGQENHPGPATSSDVLADPTRPRATPLARRLARERGLDIWAITGSGPRGRIQAEDISRKTGARAANGTPAPIEVRVPGSATARAPSRGEDGPVAVIRLREGTGRPVVLIHGFGAEANTWRPFLSGQNTAQPVYALDLPGHGGSGLGANPGFAGLVEAVEAALVGARLSAIDVVGHSLGGAVAAAIAGRGSLDIRSLLLLSPAGLGPAINGAFVQGYLAATGEASLTAWLHELVVDPNVITPTFVRATLKAREGSTLVASQRRLAEAVFPDATQAFSIRGELARLPMQTRIVQGLADKIVPAAYMAGLPGTVALHLFANVGHMPQFEARDAVAAIMAQMARA